MCRSIKVLRKADYQPNAVEVREAALQFVRKISGYRAPSKANALAFDGAVDEIAIISSKLHASLVQKPSVANGQRQSVG